MPVFPAKHRAVFRLLPAVRSKRLPPLLIPAKQPPSDRFLFPSPGSAAPVHLAVFSASPFPSVLPAKLPARLSSPAAALPAFPGYLRSRKRHLCRFRRFLRNHCRLQALYPWNHSNHLPAIQKPFSLPTVPAPLSDREVLRLFGWHRQLSLQTDPPVLQLVPVVPWSVLLLKCSQDEGDASHHRPDTPDHL